MELIRRCPECASLSLIKDITRGEIVCNDCGMVIEEKLVDHGPEWREFGEGKGQENRRTGLPIDPTIHDGGLATDVGSRYDLLKLTSKERYKFNRIKKWQVRISCAIERNLKIALADLKRISSFLKLTKAIEDEAAIIYRKAAQRGLIRGKPMENVVVSVLYISCRLHDFPRSLGEFAETSGIEKREIGKTYLYVARELGISLTPTNPHDYIPRYVSEMHLSAAVQTRSLELLNEITKKHIASGKGPTGIAAAAIYLAAIEHGERRSQRELATLAGITEVTVRNRYKDLLKNKIGTK